MSPVSRLQRGTLAAFAFYVALLALASAFFTLRNGDIDELGFLNPPYMLDHYGRLTFPAYSYGMFFDLPVITHPPLHAAWIGGLWRLGFSFYYGEATPTLLLFLLCIGVIAASAFPPPVKLGLLFSVGFLMASGESLAACFGTRPEGEVQATWLGGLVLLESARLEDWNSRKLLAGAFLLTWASGAHYYAGFAFTGAAVYLVWAIISLPWKEAGRRVAAICAGGCLFGVPYLLLYLLPYRREIRTVIQQTQGPGGVMLSVERHLELYRKLAQLGHALPALVRSAMGLGVPLLVFSTAILLLIRSTRGLALAALPLQLFLLLFAWHKLEPYLMHEEAFFVAALAIGALAAGDHLASRLPGAARRAFLPVAATLLGLYLLTNKELLAGAGVSLSRHVHEAVVARAAARQIIGPNARMGGRWGAWYSSGAEHWYDLEADLSSYGPWLHPATYVSNFDALADFPFNSGFDSGGGYSRAALSSWYATGILHLRGFYFGETNRQLQMLYLSPRPVEEVVGYGSRLGRLYRFQQDPHGDHQVLSAVCAPAPVLADANWLERWPGSFSTVLRLLNRPTDPGKLLVTVLTPFAAAEPAGWIGRSCQVFLSIRGRLQRADRDSLLAALRKEDRPMHFYRNLDQMPGYIGLGASPDQAPPSGVAPVEHVVDLAQIQAYPEAHLDRGPTLRLTTKPERGGFSAYIPLTHVESVKCPCWVQMRLKVNAGRVGFAAFDNRKGIIVRTPGLGKAAEIQTAALLVPDMHTATHIIVFNDTDLAGQVDVLDVAVLVRNGN